MARKKSEFSREFKKRSLTSSGIYDVINLIMGIIIILASIFVFIGRIKFMKAYIVVFLCAAVMNICMGIKYYNRKDPVKFIPLFIAGVFFLVLTIICIIAMF